MAIKVDKETYKRLCTLINADLNDEGKELLNPEPVVLNTGINKPLTLQEQIKRIIKTQVATDAHLQGAESFEEADDFDVDDGFETEVNSSKYELVEEEFIPDQSAHHADAEPQDEPEVQEPPPEPPPED